MCLLANIQRPVRAAVAQEADTEVYLPPKTSHHTLYPSSKRRVAVESQHAVQPLVAETVTDFDSSCRGRPWAEVEFYEHVLFGRETRDTFTTFN